jgi:hypothetical protein
MKKLFKNIIAVTVCYIIWYLLIGFISWNANITTWHWIARWLFIIFGTWSSQKALND